MMKLNGSIRSGFFSLLALIALFSAPNALAVPGVSLGLMGGGNLSFPSIDTPGVTVSGKVGYTVGPTATLGPVEASVLYSMYSVKASGIDATTDSKYLDIPVLYRFGIDLASIGVGGFYGLRLDSGATSSDNNFGAVASVRAKLPGTSVFVDGRFNLGLHDMNGGKNSSLALMLGYDFL
jgi:hypothetical protein